MRGLVHYISGLAVASLFPSLVQDAMHGSLAILVPAAYAYLPDFLDFKFYKYTEEWDYEVRPDWRNPDPGEAAAIIAKAIDDAYSSGREVRLKLHSSRAPGDLYRRYTVHFIPGRREVVVEVGPLVTLGGAPVEGTEPPPERRVGRATTRAEFRKTYPKPTVIEGFGGASMGLRRSGDLVEIGFLPWHHTWSHSFVAGILFAIPILLIAWALGYRHGFDLFLASILGYWLHVVEDQFGVMGSNLFWPFTKRKIPGFRIGESSSFETNFGTAYMAMMTMIWGFSSAQPQPPIQVDPLLYLLVVLGPGLALYLVSAGRMREELRRWGAEYVGEAEEVEETVGLRIE